MRSLLMRFFLGFWLIIALTIATAATLGFLYAERARASLENFEVSEAMLDASESLEQNGRDGLIDWLDSLPSVTASIVFVLDESDEDLLGRKVPQPVKQVIRRFERFGGMRPPRWRDRDNVRPARPFTQLVGPDGDTYTLVVLPPQNAVSRWVTERSRLTFVILLLLVSGGVSYLLARAISKPILRFRESTVAIAGGDLDTRIPDTVEKRKDEIGALAQDFNRMARKLQLAWQRQGELTSNVSHELRSPLARLKIALELARRKTGELSELDRIDAEAEKLDALVGQLLTFSKLDADMSGDRETVILAELIESVIDDVKFEHEGRDIALDFSGDDNIELTAHAGALRSAIENVLRNAVIHGGDNVQISLTEEDEQLLISVQDSGGGVAEDDLEHLFDPFYRATGSEQRDGTGLGLAIAARAVSMHDGSIDARNSEEGLLVELRLPLNPTQG
ncbi:MAG: ATP-binding protein [Woeseiaceae bacterium]|nr:ATP-binding protein [Woeseiaceae bacterium]